ncbi:glycosyltransferase [Curtobacterium sp. L1-20]|uniref:glycosyltransferase n=1 Tax=Curtobacterium sp. L1-20 TaxID=3138181 RepID=UPI003B51EA3D
MNSGAALAPSLDPTESSVRLLFSCTPAFGHFLPLVPLARAAHRAGHDVAVMTSAGMASVVAAELPDASFLAAGPMPDVLFTEVARRHPAADDAGVPGDPARVAELFAGVRVDLTMDDAVEAAGAWAPDLVVAEAVDFVGPLVARLLGIPTAVVAFGPALPEEFTSPMFLVAASRYAARGVAPEPPLAVIDPTPTLLQDPAWRPGPALLPLRAEPHRRDGESAVTGRHSGDGAVPTVLVTLGTVFADDALLQGIIASIAPGTAEVVATVGVLPDAVLPEDTATVHYERFRPMAELLEGVDVVVTAGGAGTVLAALSQGIPLVLIPQGADQPINAGRAAAAGVGLLVDHADAVGDAVQQVVADPRFAVAAKAVRDEIEARPSPDDVIAALAHRWSDEPASTRPTHPIDDQQRSTR